VIILNCCYYLKLNESLIFNEVKCMRVTILWHILSLTCNKRKRKMNLLLQHFSYRTSKKKKHRFVFHLRIFIQQWVSRYVQCVCWGQNAERKTLYVSDVAQQCIRGNLETFQFEHCKQSHQKNPIKCTENDMSELTKLTFKIVI
jgi:hypothetical protein